MQHLKDNFTLEQINNFIKQSEKHLENIDNQFLDYLLIMDKERMRILLGDMNYQEGLLKFWQRKRDKHIKDLFNDMDSD